MPSVQYVIDSLCSSVTVECVYQIVEALISEGPTSIAEIVPLVQSKDRSLDSASAETIARAALADMAQQDAIRIEGQTIRRAR
jgi:hypothetical protein